MVGRYKYHPRSISIHAPPRGATPQGVAGATSPDTFQFTPLREGRRIAESEPRRLAISIHAPPRGATCWPAGGRTRRSNFNSRPSARGDARRRRSRGCSRHFNSRPSARGDPPLIWKLCGVPHFNSRPSARGDGIAESEPRRLAISIHAPPRGATGQPRRKEGTHMISIHAPPRGATRCAGTAARPTIFQFTPLREGRPGRLSRRMSENSFQFTPLREGRRMPQASRRRRKPISIHAPPRGATRCRCGSPALP